MKLSWEILADELIGLKVEIVDSTDKGRIGIKGRVVDETMKMLVIETERGIKKVPKAECVFLFDYRGKKVKVDGRLLVARPEDRIKRAFHLKRKWRIPKFFFKRKI